VSCAAAKEELATTVLNHAQEALDDRIDAAVEACEADPDFLAADPPEFGPASEPACRASRAALREDATRTSLIREDLYAPIEVAMLACVGAD
jgi:hypothetical protein